MLAVLPGDRLEQTADEIEGAIAHPCDVSKLEQVEDLATAAFDRLGSVDLLLNNAGVGGPQGKLWDIDPAEAHAHFKVNYWGVWNGCRAFAPRMIARETPSAIFNTASENAFFCAGPRMGTYIAAKHAVLGMTASFREDLPAHVHAGTIAPGWVFTDIGPEQFMHHGMNADRFAEIVVPQIFARERFVVSTWSNVAQIRERMNPLLQAYEQYAVREEGGNDWDVRATIEQMRRR